MNTQPSAAIVASDAHLTPARHNHSFRGDVTRLVSGTVVAQLVSILAAPLLTRFYAPDAFGAAALFVSITGILGVVACMRYEFAIVLPREDWEAANLLAVSLLFPPMIAIVTTVVIWLSRGLVVDLLNIPELESFLWLIPIAVCIGGISTALNYWNTRTRQFARLSFNRVLVGLVTTGTMLGAGFAGYATAGTKIATTVLGTLVATSLLGWQIWRSDGKFLLQSIQWRQVIHGIKRYSKFPLVSTWSAFLNTTSWQLPPLVLAVFFSPTVVGYYSLGLRLVMMPMSLVGASISQVFFQRASEARANGTLPTLVEQTFQWLVQISLFPLLTLMLIGQDLFVVAFGFEWKEAGAFAQILSVLMFMQFIFSPISTLTNVLERQEIGVLRNIVLLILTALSLAIGGLVGSARLALILLSVSGSLLYISIMQFIIRLSGVDLIVPVHILLATGIKWLPVGLLLILMQIADMHTNVLIITAALFMTIYYVIVFRSHVSFTASDFHFASLRKS